MRGMSYSFQKLISQVHFSQVHLSKVYFSQFYFAKTYFFTSVLFKVHFPSFASLLMPKKVNFFNPSKAQDIHVECDDGKVF